MKGSNLIYSANVTKYIIIHIDITFPAKLFNKYGEKCK